MLSATQTIYPGRFQPRFEGSYDTPIERDRDYTLKTELWAFGDCGVDVVFDHRKKSLPDDDNEEEEGEEGEGEEHKQYTQIGNVKVFIEEHECDNFVSLCI